MTHKTQNHTLYTEVLTDSTGQRVFIDRYAAENTAKPIANNSREPIH
ncbi:hypothetical protein [Flavobacterium noncentrifugens]|nr:hypothetical protein [Flavobacterium noncentrifugens]